MIEVVAHKDRHRVVVVGIVYDAECRFLVVRRRRDIQPYPGLWTCPSGGLDIEDYMGAVEIEGGREGVLERAVRREVLEEANVEIGPCRFLNDFFFWRPNDNVTVVAIRFLCPYQYGTPQYDTKECDAIMWMNRYDVHDYPFVGNTASQLVNAYDMLQNAR